MSAPRYARLASKVLAREDPSGPALPAPGDRERAIAALAAALASRGRKRRVRHAAAVVFAVAAMFAVAFGGARLLVSHRASPAVAVVAPTVAAPVAQIVAHPVGGGSSVVVSGAEVPLDDGRALSAGSRVVTPPSGRAMLSFASGSSVLLRESTDLTVASDGAVQVFRLASGSVEIHVAKLKDGQRFLVDTPDSEVEVRGTRFRVSVVDPDAACGASVRTRVAVTEGVVVVRHEGTEDRVPAGTSWPSGCQAPAPPTAAARSPSGPLTTPSTLAEQNDLFASAVAARRRGDTRTALSLLDRFSTTYRASPLAEEVLVERMRLLRGTAHGRSVALARDYLARYPGGFARAEAEVIVAEAP
jgi:ferric-dicitrate binding protein FerR (iron transport regulator)